MTESLQELLRDGDVVGPVAYERQADKARAMGVSPRHLCDIVAGKRVPSRPMVGHVAKRLGLDPRRVHEAVIETVRRAHAGEPQVKDPGVL